MSGAPKESYTINWGFPNSGKKLSRCQKISRPWNIKWITTERMHSAMMSKRVLKSDIHLLKIRNTHWDMCCKTDRRAILHIWVVVHDLGIGRPGINRACTSSVTPDWANSAA